MSWEEKETFKNFTKNFDAENTKVGDATFAEKSDPNFVFNFIRESMASAGMTELTYNHL